MNCIFCRLTMDFTASAVHVVFGLSACGSHSARLVDEMIDGASVRQILAAAKAGLW